MPDYIHMLIRYSIQCGCKAVTFVINMKTLVISMIISDGDYDDKGIMVRIAVDELIDYIAGVYNKYQWLWLPIMINDDDLLMIVTNDLWAIIVIRGSG